MKSSASNIANVTKLQCKPDAAIYIVSEAGFPYYGQILKEYFAYICKLISTPLVRRPFPDL